MLRKPKLYNEDFLNEVGSLKDISKLKNLGVANPEPTNNFDPVGTSYPETQAMAPIQIDDIRKNESPYFKLGRYLGNEQQAQQPVEQPQPEMPEQQQLPAFQSAKLPDYTFGLSDFIKNNREGVGERLAELGQKAAPIVNSTAGLAGYLKTPSFENSQQLMQESAPQEVAPPAQPLNEAPGLNIPQTEMGLQMPKAPGAQIEDAVKQRVESGESPIMSIPGSVETALATPKYKSVMEKLFGGTIDPELAKGLKNTEIALNEEGLSTDTEIAGLQKRIDSHELTTQDKILMGLALLAPAIIGGIVGGPEGILKSLGGGLEKLGEGLVDISKENRADVKELAKAKATKTGIELKKVKLTQEKLKAIPNHELRQALSTKGVEEVVDQKGNVLGYGIPTSDKDLLIDAKKVRNIDDLKAMQKLAPEMALANANVVSINKELDDLSFILKQLKGKSKFRQLLEEKSGLLQQKVTTRQGDVLNAGAALHRIDEFLKDAYNKSQGFKALTGNNEKHWNYLGSIPSEGSVYAGRGIDDIENGVNQFRDLVNDKYEQKLQSSGFLVEPFQKKIGESEAVQSAEAQRKANLATHAIMSDPAKRAEAMQGKPIRIKQAIQRNKR